MPSPRDAAVGTPAARGDTTEVSEAAGKGNSDSDLRKPTDNSLSPRGILYKILPAAGGSFIEWYEFAIYSYLTPYITANFFADGRGGSLGTWAGFAITFAFRPLGGALFGYLADQFGRKPAMQLTIALMLVTTVLQGCLPSFLCCGDEWGWFGLATLLVMRAAQGLSAGGELSTAAVYISEISPHADLGRNLAWVSVSGAFGAWTVAAMVVYVIELCVSHQDMLEWGWRLPYLTSVAPGICLVLARRFLEETPDFEQLTLQHAAKREGGGAGADNAAVASVEDGLPVQPTPTQSTAASSYAGRPMQELWAQYKTPLAIGALGCAGCGCLWFVPPVYGVQFIARYNGLPATAVTFSEILTYLIPTLLAVPVGALIDRVGVGKIYFATIVIGCLLAPAPLFYWWTHTPQSQAIASVFIGQCLLGLVQSLTTSVYLWLVELFPVRLRVTGVSIAYNIGVGVFGGLGPLLSDAGNDLISPKGPLSAPAIFTLACGVISTAAVVASRVLGRQGKMRLTHIREAPY